MKTIQPSFEIVSQEAGIIGMKKKCERAGRICYRSENNITDTSYMDMLAIFNDRKHYSPLAHGCVTMMMTDVELNRMRCDLMWEIKKDVTAWQWFNNPLWTRIHQKGYYNFITTNYRVIKELSLEKYMESNWCEPTEYHTPVYSVILRTDIGVTREFNRHASSIAICEESTRYCNYSKNKFGSEITFIRPDDFDEDIEAQMIDTEKRYMSQINKGKAPQLARRVLLLETATRVMYTGFIDAWEHIFSLRTAPAAHPDMQKVAKMIRDKFKELDYIK